MDLRLVQDLIVAQVIEHLDRQVPWKDLPPADGLLLHEALLRCAAVDLDGLQEFEGP